MIRASKEKAGLQTLGLDESIIFFQQCEGNLFPLLFPKYYYIRWYLYLINVPGFGPLSTVSNDLPTCALESIPSNPVVQRGTHLDSLAATLSAEGNSKKKRHQKTLVAVSKFRLWLFKGADKKHAVRMLFVSPPLKTFS